MPRPPGAARKKNGSGAIQYANGRRLRWPAQWDKVKEGFTDARIREFYRFLFPNLTNGIPSKRLFG
jgi:hypothetical protein